LNAAFFGADCIRANDSTSILRRTRTSFEGEKEVVRGDKKTVAGNLREIAMRLAPGRACISVVFDHGISKDRRGMPFIPAC
jgi:hypothetical protein